MRILVLGGTTFVGRAVVADALAHGAEVTLFNRGRTGSGLFPEVERRIGDRETGDYASLATGEWDAVVDVSGYQTREVDQAMDALGNRVGRYVFISSHAVYIRDDVAPGSDETLTRREPLRAAEVLDNETYGRCKVACEDDVLARYGDRATLVRPGRVAGPYDDADTVLYWARRGARGGRVALPTSPDQPLQLTDSRDLGRLVVQLVTDDRGGAFNAVGEQTSIGGLLHTAAAIAGTEVDLVQVPRDAVPERFPLLEPERHWTSRQRNPAKARAAGMTVTPLRQTLDDLLTWDASRGTPPLSTGLTSAEEADLLANY